jgi:hypothetical protein
MAVRPGVGKPSLWADNQLVGSEQALKDRYGGLLNDTLFTADFVNYAKTVVESFGDKVEYYGTFNGA